jgi:hypothetical protein
MRGVITGLLALLCVVVGCQNKPEDDVVAQYKRGEEAISLNDPVAFRAVQTPESTQLVGEAQRLALTSPAAETKKLPPSTLALVLAMRNRLDPARLRTNSVDDLLAWMMDQDLLVVDKEYGLHPSSVKITGDTATIQMGIEVEREPVRYGGRRRAAGVAVALIGRAVSGPDVVPIPGFIYHCKNIGGFWYMDGVAGAERRDAEWIEEANETKVPVHELVASSEEESYGSLKKDIWTPKR